MNQSKQELRLKYKEIRQKEKENNSDFLIIDRLLKSEIYREADTVLCYSSVGSEIDTLPVIRDVLLNGKVLALPVCVDRDGHMEFYVPKDEVHLKTGAFSIAEPDIEKCRKLDTGNNILCIVPGIAFDHNGYRLGYGKGYYDRFLSSFKGLSVGLCYESCFCEQLPFDCFDCKVDIIITEKDIYSVNKEEYIYG